MIPHGQQNKEIQAERSRHLADLRAVFTTSAGQRVLDGLKSRAGIHRPAAIVRAGEPVDPYLTLYRDGRRSIILELLADLATAENESHPGPAAVA